MQKFKFQDYLILLPFASIPILGLIIFNGNLTALIHISESLIQEGLNYWQEPIFYLKVGGYDGQYYFLNMFDISNKTGAVPTAYQSRVLFPSVVYLLRKLLSIESASYILYSVNLLSILASWILIKKIYLKYQVAGFYRYLFLNIGLLTSFKYGLTEPLSILFLIFALYCFEFQKGWQQTTGVFIFLTLSLLSRDAFVFAVLGLACFSLITKRWALVAATVLSVLPILGVKHYLAHGQDINNKLGLFKLDSFIEYTLPLLQNRNFMGQLNFALSLLFLLFLALILFKVLLPSRAEFRNSPYFLISLFCLIFLGFFNPTAAWSNISGISRHLVCLFPFLPIVFSQSGASPKAQKFIVFLNFGFVFIFYIWFIKSLFQEYFLFYPA